MTGNYLVTIFSADGRWEFFTLYSNLEEIDALAEQLLNRLKGNSNFYEMSRVLHTEFIG